MRTIKPYLSLIALAFVCSTYAQSNITINGRTYTLTRNPLAFEDFRVRSQFNLPTTLRSTADPSAMAFTNNKYYGRRLVNGVETWVPFLDSTEAVTSEALDKYQFSTNLDVTVEDTTTVLVLNDDGDNTANRNITLKSPSAGKSLKILNYNSGIYSNVLTTGILGRDGILFSVLKQPATYTLISDGGMWRVLAVSEDVEGGGGGSGGGNSSGAIVTWD